MVDPDQLGAGDRRDRRGRWSTVEQRHLADDLAGAELADRHLIAVSGHDGDGGPAPIEDVDGRARHVLLDDRLAGGAPADAGVRRQRGEGSLIQAPEERDSPERFDVDSRHGGMLARTSRKSDRPVNPFIPGVRGGG